MRQTMKWNRKLGLETYWLSFSSQNNSSHSLFTIRDDPGHGLHINLPGGWDCDVICTWLRFLRPCFIHHQGDKAIDIIRTGNKLGIPVISGLNFWHGAVVLSAPWANINIIEHATDHSTHEDFDEILKNATVYCASEFMQTAIETITSKRVPFVLCPIPSHQESISLKERQPKYVTLINCHVTKGGDILLALMRALPDVAFCAVRTENYSERLDEQIKSAIAYHKTSSIYLEYTPDIREVYRQTRILIVPSHCDETFCRVAVEGLFNGIPIVSSGQGNLKCLLDEESLVPITNIPAWIDRVRSLWTDIELYKSRSTAALERSKLFHEDTAFLQYQSILASGESRRNNAVMIFTAWNDQGLGIQSRAYDRIIRDAGLPVHIFAYRPYFSTPENPRHQIDPNEWRHPSIYYSPNVREQITDDEITSFLTTHRIGVCIVPETVNERVFGLARLLRYWCVRTIAIPNIEIVRRDEIQMHTHFDVIYCNNRLCQRIFAEHGLSAVEIGYGVKHPLAPLPFYQRAAPDNGTRILAVGGMNAFARKQIDVLVRAAVRYYELYGPGLFVTVTIQSGPTTPGYTEIECFANHPSINLIARHLTRPEINELLDSTDWVYFQSKREGLGLGFYEALSRNVPVLSLDAEPFNEIIIDGVNGLLMECTREPMQDNPMGFLLDCVATIDKLVPFLRRAVTYHRDQRVWHALLKSTYDDSLERLSWDAFRKRFLSHITALY